ncbi:DUF6524 family protein [Azospirillum thermophilum]|uniref:Uncharacterized protein n=1 Tax=Azospirillum thermophilum TaxID=2202148 RepID=A0A2S2CR13_9PROT|nr:DUF6524 family protein [Azospirillum thermophilum]AWK86926.1 hypothetical protein DEW08_12420 [Azospirillum thermophilum]
MLTIPGYLVRLLIAMLVIFGSYNPSGYSYYHWLHVEIGDWALKLFVGLVLLILFYLQIRAMWRSMRFVGTTTLSAIIATSVWLASDLGLVDLSDDTARILVVQVALAILLGTGFCWSHIRYRLSGQVDSENIAA